MTGANSAVKAAALERPDLAVLIDRYFRHVSVEDLPAAAADVLSIVTSHLRLANQRTAGIPNVRVFNPQSATDEWSADSTVIDLVNDDMPYLVDSVTSALTAAEVVVHRVLHPILDVRRDPAGLLVETLGRPAKPAAGHRPRDVRHESWMHLLIDRITDAERAERIEADLAATLNLVRDVVEDSAEMADTARQIAAAIRRNPPRHAPAAEIIETADLLEWLADGHLTFLGVQQYDIGDAGPDPVADPTAAPERLLPVADSGLGLLRDNTDPDGFTAAIPAPADTSLLVVSKASRATPLAKNLPPFYVAVRLHDDAGVLIGELRFLGILTARALNAEVAGTPVLRRLVDSVLLAVGSSAESYNGQRALELLTGYPRAELFWAAEEDVIALVRGVLQSTARRQLRLFLQPDPFGRFTSAMVFIPRDRYTTTARLAMQKVLLERLAGARIRYTARVGDNALAAVHFTIETDPSRPVDVDVPELTEAVRRTSRTWEDELAAGVLGAGLDDDTDASDVLDTAGERSRYGRAFDEAYKEDYSSAEAVVDLHRLDALTGPDDLALAMEEAGDARPGNRRLKVFVAGSTITLSRALPLLQSLGAIVVDENPYQVTRSDGINARIYDFGLQLPAAYLRSGDEEVAARQRVVDAFTAAWSGRSEVDGLNELVLAADLDWRQVTVFRAYAKYLRQVRSPYTQGYLESVLVAHAEVAKLLAGLFAARFDPAFTARGAGEDDRLIAVIDAQLEQVTSLDADRILRTFLQLILATQRTNAFRHDADGELRTFWSFKLDPHRLDRLPRPVPAHEIWVYSPLVEGVHLRFGDIARGGLRWSDRPEDFRTEILGLVKAQEVKNAVIVPVGAKGGFVVKQPAVLTGDPGADRETQLAEGIRCYRMFIQGMLDLTDNRVGTRIVPPPEVIRHDPDDSYLVVAADKGTATFSDIANGVAMENGFWLGDAFASGGSAGYDHKKMGITARGAWESVKQHFRELGVDTQAEDFTVVGVGDMSGDVFGNGMLLSEHIRLVAAFDHRHIFIDPAPDSAASFAERRRLFELPRSSWSDYDHGLISAGGGVWPRTAKSIPISAEMRSALGIGAADGGGEIQAGEGRDSPAATVGALSPTELISAILCAPVDLLFNGGVGTYVKASGETNLQVGDKANDALRVDGEQLRVKVIGEGGNLGVTQLGRVEFAQAGGKVNTDAIDNSAGVDTSDHEVNIKIALQPVDGGAGLAIDERNELLQAMTDDVAALVLADNTTQNRLLSVSRQHAPEMISVHARLIDDLVASGRLDRRLEYLPSNEEIGLRQAAGLPLTSPELSVLIAYVKSSLAHDMLASELPDAAAFAHRLARYFPALMRDRHPAAIEMHPLRRNIITTMTVNEVVNGAGVTYAFRLAEEMAAGPSDAIRAYAVTTEVFALDDLWAEIARRDNAVSTTVQNSLTLISRRLLDRATRWLLVRRPQPLDVSSEIQRYQPVVEELTRQLPRLLCGSEHEHVRADAGALSDMGAPPGLATRLAYSLFSFSLLDVAEVASGTGRSPFEVAELYYALSEHIGLDRILSSVSALDRGNRWHALARQAIRDGLYTSLRAITADVLSTTHADQDAAAKIAQWEDENRFRLERARITLGQIAKSGVADLAALSVAAREIRTMAR